MKIPTNVVLDFIRSIVIGDQGALKMTASIAIQAIPQAVLDAALALHQQKSTGLTYSPFSTAEATTAEGNPSWRYGENKIEFANLDVRNRCTALAIFQQLMPFNGTEALFDKAYELWRNEIGHPDSASGRLLGLAGESVNVLLEAARIIGNKERRVFDVLHLLEKALPYLPSLPFEQRISWQSFKPNMSPQSETWLVG